MVLTSTINAWADMWAAVMVRGLIEASVLLLLVTAVWLAFRKRMSAHLACGLFLLVPLKLILPIPITVPSEAVALLPAAMTGRDSTEVGIFTNDDLSVEPPLVVEADFQALSEEIPPWAPIRAPGRNVRPVGEGSARPGHSTIEASGRISEVPARSTGLTSASKLMVLWIAVVAALLLVFARRHLRMALLVRRSGPPAPGSLPVDLPRLCRLSGLRLPVEAVSAPWAASPAVWGLLRPRLLVPPDLAAGLGPDGLRWVFLHELAHVRRRDGWVALFQRLVQIAYFFHPAVWLANRMIDIQREYACDDGALAVVGVPRRACGDGLLTIVERANASPASRMPALGLLHSPALIRRRLMRILDARRPVHAKLTAAAGALLALAAIVCLPRVQARQERPPAPPAPRQSPEVGAEPKSDARDKISILVVDDASGEPLPDAAIEVRSYRLGYKETNLTADDQGRAEISVPAATPEWIGVAVHSDGFLPLEVLWKAEDLLSNPPSEQTFRLTRGEAIGGVVRDEQGEPIAGAKVSVWIMTPTRQEGVRVSTARFPVETDAEGRWRAAYLPEGSDPETRVMLRLEHPDFVSEPGGFRRSMTAQEAQTFENVEVLTAGVSMEGLVLGANDEPVEGAGVAIDEAEYADSSDNAYRVATDASGRFRIAHIRRREEGSGRHLDQLSIQAPGLAPQVRQVEIGPDADPIEIRLEAAKPLSGRVVDKEGRPLAGAAVAVGSYDGARTLEWRGLTDAEGRFTWPDGPARGTAGLEAYQAPYLRAIQRSVPAGTETAEIVLHRPFLARGTVVDAKSEEPIARFVLTPGTGPSPPDDRYMWDRSEARECVDGTFDEEDLFSMDQPLGKALMVEADGYLPQIFDGFSTADESVEHAFQLSTAEPITGIVRDPEGNPIAGATVELSFSARDTNFGNARTWPPVSGEFKVETDDEGRYTIQPRERPFGVVVRNESGFARVWPSELSRSADVTLQPWGRIEGTYRAGDQPAANVDVNISIDMTTAASTDYEYGSYKAKTDAEGRFEVDRVVPGFATAFTPTVGPYSFEVRSGESARITIGGSGRSVIGRVVTSEETTLPFPLNQGGLSRLVSVMTELPKPEGFAAMSQPERASYHGAWYQTSEGRAWKLNYQGNPIRVAADGTFRAEDVPPGTYQLEIRISDSDTLQIRDEGGTTISASIVKEVTIPDGPADEPVNLGTLVLDVLTRNYEVLAVGEHAPEIEGATTLDREPLRLSDYRGKYVILDFWATWCGPCLKEEPHLKSAREAFKDDDRVVFIGLSLDEDVEAPKRHVEARDLDWIQGFLGEPGAGVTARFGVSSIPQTLLIGPDGTVLAKDLRGTRIKAAIAEALARR